MPCHVTRSDILSLTADAAVLCVENTMEVAAEPISLRLAGAGGPALQEALNKLRFIPVGSAAVVAAPPLPFRYLLVTAAPHWLTGKANELLVLHRCYERVFALAEELGCRSIALPFFSSTYYRFPLREAVHIALGEAEKSAKDVCFAVGSAELLALSQTPYRKPEILSYIGYYRDHALFELDNGLFARVDLRPENTGVELIPYFEACFRAGNNPLQPPLPEEEITRLRRIYEENSW